MDKTKKKGRKQDTFDDFARTTIDAWDANDDDDDELCSVVSNLSVRDKNTVPRSQHSSSGATSLSSSAYARNKLSNKKANEMSKNKSAMSSSSPRLSHVKGLTGSLSRSSSAPSTPVHNLSGQRFQGKQTGGLLVDSTKLGKFRQLCLAEASVDLDELRKISWSGIPSGYRPVAWKLLAGYLPASVERRQAQLERKRGEYHKFVEQYFCARFEETYQDTYQQIHIDVPRMSPLIPIFQQQVVRDMFERILFIWSIRHPASGYVQGINDLVTPFFVVFLSEHLPDCQQNGLRLVDIEHCQVEQLAADSLQQLEADCFWCFSKLLDGIQDYYTFAQPGIQMHVTSLCSLTRRVDAKLHAHLTLHGIDYLQFSYRWMNNLLMRELPLNCVIRLWDTYLSERDGFASFHLYVCTAFLTHFSATLLQEADFHGLMTLIQNLPTSQWTEASVGEVLAEAYRLKFTFADAPNHLRDAVDTRQTSKSGVR